MQSANIGTKKTTTYIHLQNLGTYLHMYAADTWDLKLSIPTPMVPRHSQPHAPLALPLPHTLISTHTHSLTHLSGQGVRLQCKLLLHPLPPLLLFREATEV